MKKIYFIAIIITALFLPGCGRENTEKQMIEMMRTQINGKYQNQIEEQQSQKNITIKLNSVVFEETDIIIDYALQAKEEVQYADILPSVKIDGRKESGGMGLICYSNKNEKNYIYRCKWKNLFLNEKDIGKKAEVIFESVTGTEDINVTFPTEIKSIYQPKTIPVNEEIVYGQQSVMIESLKMGICCMDIKYNTSDTDFLSGFQEFKVVAKSGEVLPGIGADEEAYQYIKIKDCPEINISVVEYRKNNKIKQLSNEITINLL